MSEMYFKEKDDFVMERDYGDIKAGSHVIVKHCNQEDGNYDIEVVGEPKLVADNVPEGCILPDVVLSDHEDVDIDMME